MESVHRVNSTLCNVPRASLVVQWQRIHLHVQETRAHSLVWEDSPCRTASKPGSHTTEPAFWSPGAGSTLHSVLHNTEATRRNQKVASTRCN